MKVIFNRKFLEKVKKEFEDCGFGNAAWDNIGFLFSEVFFDNLEKSYKENPNQFLNLVELEVPDNE